jgi:adenosine deaminase
VADLVRDYGPAAAAITLAEVNEVRNLGVIGIGIGGMEKENPPEPFADVYEEARRMGFRTSAHAGEAAGPESVWGAVHTLRVDRIGHATRAAEDERLLDCIAEKRIPLELCPLSNLRTGVVRRIEDHPVRKYFERGLLIAINSDDPKMFGNSLAQEYQLLDERLGFSRDDIRNLIVQGVQATWMPEEKKQRLIVSFRADPAWCEKDELTRT